MLIIHNLFNIFHALPFFVAEPPSVIRNLNVTFVDQMMVNLSWEHPADLGGRRDISYKVECVGCPPTVIYKPAQKGFNTTK